ncbi:MAG: hypothetical protein OXH51_06675 [Gemmatimonadetes bacterium]|nr:hypothetical protein [Gemmatimonadota bacterium]
MESRFDGLEGRFDGLESRFDGLERRFDGLESQVGQLDRKFTERFDRLEKMLEGVIDKDFPPVDQQARSGGPPGTIGVAAKGR